MEEASGDGNVVNFSNLDELSTKEIVSQAVVNAILEHLESLKNSFEGYFDIDNLPSELWVRNPFTILLDEIGDNDLAKDELIDLRSNKQLKINFDAIDISTFWCEVAATHPTFQRGLGPCWSHLPQPSFVSPVFLQWYKLKTNTVIGWIFLMTCELPCQKPLLALLI